jgi:hypothetical protein
MFSSFSGVASNRLNVFNMVTAVSVTCQALFGRLLRERAFFGRVEEIRWTHILLRYLSAMRRAWIS